MNSALEAFFDSLAAEADLDRLVQERRAEDLYLEFKEKSDRRTGNLDDPDRLSFSQALSGFANADGGVLVFGVATTKAADGIDRADSLKPIGEHQRFRARLMDSILNTTQPVVDGVRVEPVPAASGGGYLKCFVPQSDKLPHRAMVGREYWRRVTTGYRRMEHYELEDAFGRRSRPVLRPRIELHPRPDPDPHEELHFLFLNEGRGIAQHAGLMCRLAGAEIVGVRGDGLQDVSSINNRVPTVMYYDAHSVIHPNGIWRFLGHAIIKRADKGTPLSVALTWYAADMATGNQLVEATPKPSGDGRKGGKS